MASYKADYRVINISEAQPGRLTVNFQQDGTGQPGGMGFATGPVSLNLTVEEAADYFPGQIYVLELVRKPE